MYKLQISIKIKINFCYEDLQSFSTACAHLVVWKHDYRFPLRTCLILRLLHAQINR
ncbi:hypothetical protein Hanom_Chr07g00602041 [Helianthus anomalus]